MGPVSFIPIGFTRPSESECHGANDVLIRMRNDGRRDRRSSRILHIVLQYRRGQSVLYLGKSHSID